MEVFLRLFIFFIGIENSSYIIGNYFMFESRIYFGIPRAIGNLFSFHEWIPTVEGNRFIEICLRVSPSIHGEPLPKIFRFYEVI